MKGTCKEFRLDRSLEASSTLIFGFPVVPWMCFRYLVATIWIYVCQDYLWVAVTLLLRHSNCAKFHTLWRAKTVSNYSRMAVNWP